jgi:uncharacterized RDD family membrane protein YckC
MKPEIIPVEIVEINDNIYSGFWPRLGAMLLDGIIMIPVLIVTIFLDSFDKHLNLLTLFAHFLFNFWYSVYLPYKYGGTPGKLIVGIRIVKLDASAIGWREAVLRESVYLIISVIDAIIMTAAIFMADNEVYKNLGWVQQMEYLDSFAVGSGIRTSLLQLWTWSEMIVLLTNKRKRAIHDFIAGTVIVKSKYIEKIREKMEGKNELVY